MQFLLFGTVMFELSLRLFISARHFELRTSALEVSAMSTLYTFAALTTHNIRDNVAHNNAKTGEAARSIPLLQQAAQSLQSTVH